MIKKTSLKIHLEEKIDDKKKNSAKPSKEASKNLFKKNLESFKKRLNWEERLKALWNPDPHPPKKNPD